MRSSTVTPAPQPPVNRYIHLGLTPAQQSIILGGPGQKGSPPLPEPPLKATSPSVPSGSGGGSTTPILTWLDGGGATSYNVYFNGVFAGNQATTSYTPAALSYLTTYTWRVDAVNAGGTTAGDTWSFTTIMGSDRWYFSNAIPAPSTSFSIGFEGAGSRIVDWGDGNTDTTSGDLVNTHVYAAAGNYVFSVRQSTGATTRLYFWGLAGSTLLTGILTPPNGMTGLTSLSFAFLGCTGLTGSIPSLSTLTGLTNLTYAFYSCTGLTGSIPSLSSLTGLTTLYAAFDGCTGLTGSIPSLSTLTGLTNLSYAFNGCTGLTGSIPSLSTLTGLTTLYAAFNGCTGLTGSIPSLSSLTGLTSLSYAFLGCTGLVGNTRTVAQIFGGSSYPNLTSANQCFSSSVPFLLGNAADFISLTKNAGFTVGTGSGNGSYNMFSGQTSLSDYATTPLAWGGLGEVVTHPTASAWAANVVTNGGAAPSDGTVSALSTFCYALDSAGLTSSMLAVNCYVPDSLIAATTPLIATACQPCWTNHNFVSGDLSVNGLQGNRSNKYLDLGSQSSPASTALTLTSAGLTCYVPSGGANAVENTCGICGAGCCFDLNLNYSEYFGFQCWDWGDAGQAAWRPGGIKQGFFSGSRTAADEINLYFANAGTAFSSVASAATTSGGVASGNMFEFSEQYGGGPNAYSPQAHSFFAMHLGLSSEQTQALYNAVQALRTALGGGYI